MPLFDHGSFGTVDPLAPDVREGQREAAQEARRERSQKKKGGGGVPEALHRSAAAGHQSMGPKSKRVPPPSFRNLTRNPRRSHDAHQKKRKKKKPPPLSTPESSGNTIELNDLNEEAYEPPKQRLNRVPSGSARQSTPTRHRSEEILTRASKVHEKLARRRATREMVASSSDLLRSEQSPRPQSPGTPLDGPRPEGASTKIAPPTREESDAIFNILDVDKGERRDSGCGGWRAVRGWWCHSST